MTLTDASKLFAAALIIAGLACALSRHVVAIQSDEPDKQSSDAMCAIGGGLGVLGALLEWGI